MDLYNISLLHKYYDKLNFLKNNNKLISYTHLLIIYNSNR